MQTIAVDFDGVIHAYSKGWHDGTIYDVPVAGAKEALTKLRAEYHVIIFSTRNHNRIVMGKHQPNQVVEMVKWFKKHDIPYDEIWTSRGKPLCSVFIDDHAIRFENWAQTLEQIK